MITWRDVGVVLMTILEVRSVMFLIAIGLLMTIGIWMTMKKTHLDVNNPLIQNNRKVIGGIFIGFTCIMLLVYANILVRDIYLNTA